MFVLSDEVPPFCHTQGCSCPTGYELIETVQSKTCRLIESTSDLSAGESEEERRMFCPYPIVINCEQMTQLSISFGPISFSAVWRWEQLPSKCSMRMGGKWVAQQVRLSSRIRRRRLRMCWAWSLVSICKFISHLWAVNESNNKYSNSGKCVRCSRYMCLRRGGRKIDLQVREALRRRR